jgi:hypothetical protein
MVREYRQVPNNKSDMLILPDKSVAHTRSIPMYSAIKSLKTLLGIPILTRKAMGSLK